MSETIHLRLRRATAAQHAELEARLDLLGPGLSLERYRRVLGAFLGYYAPVEARLAALAPAAPPLGVPPRSRAALLRRDLVALGLTPQELAALPRCAELPRLAGVADLAGCVYVLEGASLGGQVVARAVERRLGMGAGDGAAFFVGDGAGTRARWRQVLAWLEEVAASAADAEAVVAAGGETFRTFGLWLHHSGAVR